MAKRGFKLLHRLENLAILENLANLDMDSTLAFLVWSIPLQTCMVFFWKSPFGIGDTSSNGCFFHCHASFWRGTSSIRVMTKFGKIDLPRLWDQLLRERKLQRYASWLRHSKWLKHCLWCSKTEDNTYCERFFPQVLFHSKIPLF